MKKFRRKTKLAILFAAALAIPVLASANGASAATNNFRGVNWADARDNYVNGWVIPTGLSSSDNYSTVRSKADGIISGFQSLLGANTVRLPINPESVNSSWWSAYKGAIDSSLNHGMKVILSFWAESNSYGTIPDTNAWNTMWDTVTNDYGSNSSVYFEPMNEPYGYSLSSWVSVCSSWLSRHSSISHGRVIISGTGYNDNVTGVGASSALSGTLLSLHFYGYWASDTTVSAWTTNLTNRIGSYASRTIIDEAGAPMTTGLTYTGSQNQNTQYTAYFGATTDYARNNSMGVVYWPGLRSGDSYSITRQNGSGLAVNNSSGVAQLRWGWGL